MSFQVLLCNMAVTYGNDKHDCDEDNGFVNAGYWRICCFIFCFCMTGYR